MASAYTKGLIKEFVTEHGADIVYAIANTGLFFSAVVGQLSVESENGQSRYAREYNNYGGVFGSSSSENVVYVKATNRWVRVFDSFADFMTYYVNNFRSSRYIQAGVFQAKTPEEQIKRIVQAGYSEDTPSQYLALGVKDRIKATQELYPWGQISDEQYAIALDNASRKFDPTPIGCFDVFGMKLGDL